MLLLAATAPVQADLVEDLAAAAPGENGCSKTEDGDWWQSDNEAKCTLRCDPDLYLSIEVSSADDEGRYPAYVYGDVECGGGSADCADDGSCSGGGSTSGAAKTSTSGTGDCNGYSDEMVQSTLTVSCSAADVSSPDPPDEWCPVTAGPLNVCLDLLPDGLEQILRDLLDDPPVPPLGPVPPGGPGPAPGSSVTRLLPVDPALEVGERADGPGPLLATGSVGPDAWSRATRIDATLAQDAATHPAYVWMHYDGEAALGITCHHGVCDDFVPVLEREGGRVRLGTP